MSERKIITLFSLIFCCIMVAGSCAPKEVGSKTLYKKAASSTKKSGILTDAEREKQAKQIFFEAEA